MSHLGISDVLYLSRNQAIRLGLTTRQVEDLFAAKTQAVSEANALDLYGSVLARDSPFAVYVRNAMDEFLHSDDGSPVFEPDFEGAVDRLVIAEVTQAYEAGTRVSGAAIASAEAALENPTAVIEAQQILTGTVPDPGSDAGPVTGPAAAVLVAIAFVVGLVLLVFGAAGGR